MEFEIKEPVIGDYILLDNGEVVKVEDNDGVNVYLSNDGFFKEGLLCKVIKN